MSSEFCRTTAEKLSGLFYRFDFDVTFFLCSITDAVQLDAAEEWLKKHHPEMARKDDFVAWMKEGITKWGGKLREQFSGDFMERFPFVANKLNASAGNMLIFLRMAEFCGADPEFLAEQVEAIIRAHDVEGKKFIFWQGLHAFSHRWVNHPRNARCFVISTIAYYTQTPAWVFGRVFLPEGRRGGGVSSGNGSVYIDWRSKEEQERTPVWKIRS
jgi:hypothetical protein